MCLAPEFLPIHHSGRRRCGLWGSGLRRHLRSNRRRCWRRHWFCCGRECVPRGARRRGRGSGSSRRLDLCLLRWRGRCRRRRTRRRILLCNLDVCPTPVRLLDINRDRRHGKSGHNRSRNPNQPPLFPPCIRRNSVAWRRGCGHVAGIGGLARHRHHLPATSADGKMRKHVSTLLLAKRPLGKCAQALRIGMKSVLACRSHDAACSWNASDCEFCSSFFRFTSMSRESAPIASCAARRLIP